MEADMHYVVTNIEVSARFSSENKHNRNPRSTQPCIPPGSLNRVPASAGVKAGKSPLPGGK